MNQDKISAFVDGELDDDQNELMLSLLRSDHGRDSWDVYHQIGDTLRSDELAFNMSADFSARLAARLEKEPTILAATLAATSKQGLSPAEPRRAANDASGTGVVGWFSAQKLTLAGIVSAALAAVLLISAPPLMVASNGVKDSNRNDVGAGTNSKIVRLADSSGKTMSSTSNQSSGTSKQSSSIVVADRNGMMLRDPRIDDYLSAHQRFSPSVYSTAQYVRSAAFVSDPGQ